MTFGLRGECRSSEVKVASKSYGFGYRWTKLSGLDLIGIAPTFFFYAGILGKVFEVSH